MAQAQVEMAVAIAWAAWEAEAEAKAAWLRLQPSPEGGLQPSLGRTTWRTPQTEMDEASSAAWTRACVACARCADPFSCVEPVNCFNSSDSVNWLLILGRLLTVLGIHGAFLLTVCDETHKG